MQHEIHTNVVCCFARWSHDSASHAIMDHIQCRLAGVVPMADVLVMIGDSRRQFNADQSNSRPMYYRAIVMLSLSICSHSSAFVGSHTPRVANSTGVMVGNDGGYHLLPLPSFITLHSLAAADTGFAKANLGERAERQPIKGFWGLGVPSGVQGALAGWHRGSEAKAFCPFAYKRWAKS